MWLGGGEGGNTVEGEQERRQTKFRHGVSRLTEAGRERERNIKR